MLTVQKAASTCLGRRKSAISARKRLPQPSPRQTVPQVVQAWAIQVEAGHSVSAVGHFGHEPTSAATGF